MAVMPVTNEGSGDADQPPGWCFYHVEDQKDPYQGIYTHEGSSTRKIRTLDTQWFTAVRNKLDTAHYGGRAT